MEVKKAVSQEEMRKTEPPKRGGSSSYYGRDSGSVYSRGDPYASYQRGGMGYGAMSKSLSLLPGMSTVLRPQCSLPSPPLR